MITIVTHVHLREGAGRDWDAAMRTRLSAARKASGWIGGQLFRPADQPDRRVIVGTWKARANWEAWHHDPQFTGTRQARRAGEHSASPDFLGRRMTARSGRCGPGPASATSPSGCTARASTYS
jgi:heme-degrading monooxygenase HmoA